MMEWLRGLWYWVAARDPALNFDRRLGRWVNIATATGMVVTAGGWVVGSPLNLPWFAGLLVGLVAWVVLNAFVAVGRRSLRPVGEPTGERMHLAPTAEDLERLREEVRETKADLRRSEQESERLRAERDNFRAAETLDEGKNLDGDLKRRCLELAEKLHRFLEDHALEDADRAEMMVADFGLDIARADAETMSRFRKHLKRQTMEMLAELKRRGLWEPDGMDLEERESFKSPGHPRDLWLIAEYLERFGYGL